jgi:hypothetical protein
MNLKPLNFVNDKEKTVSASYHCGDNANTSRTKIICMSETHHLQFMSRTASDVQNISATI